ncbi:MAG: aminotransferase class V-fold PLP-dependent enzyme [Caulobacterales bacterium]|nr:aminotransferase class V-fold PLP-dependent enzyme [Caulobacterales bacterium]
MQTAMDWLAERRGVEVVSIALPEPATRQSLIDAYEEALKKHPRTRLALATHLSHRTGLVLPIADICDLARAHDADVIVDAAHSWGQLDFAISDLKADFVGVNLHKWIGAPLGVGAMVVREDRIADIDPYMAEPEHDPRDPLLARVHTGTFNYAAFLAVPDALDLHAAIGPARKEARLRHLRSLWAEALRDHPGVDILTPADPRLHGGITSFRLTGRITPRENRAVARELLDRFGIFTVHRTGVAAGACVRATPALFTSEEDVARLTAALREMASA